jgi:hypothetical protein
MQTLTICAMNAWSTRCPQISHCFFYFLIPFPDLGPAAIWEPVLIAEAHKAGSQSRNTLAKVSRKLLGTICKIPSRLRKLPANNSPHRSCWCVTLLSSMFRRTMILGTLFASCSVILNAQTFQLLKAETGPSGKNVGPERTPGS